MKICSMALLLALLLSQATGVHAQTGSIISVISGIFTARNTQRTEDQMNRDAEEWIKEEAEREEKIRQRQAAMNADIERQRAAEAEAARLAEERVVAVKSGKIKASTISDLDALYDAEDGSDIAASPKIKADRAQYLIVGKISRHVADDIFICETLPEDDEFLGHYYTVRITKKTKKKRDIFDRMRIGGELYVVGKYIGNFNYQTVAGAWSVMPIFDAVHIVVPGDD